MDHNKNKKLLLGIIIIFIISITTVIADSETDYIKRMIEKHYIETLKYNEIKGSSPKEIFKNLDKHSEYYTASEFSNLLNALNDSSVSGIGIYIKTYLNIGVQVTEIIENSPAEKSGLKYGDIILSVNNIDLMENDNIDQIASLIRGPIGTCVSLTVKSIGNEENKTISVKREAIKENSIQKRILDKNIGYIKIRNFNKGSGVEFKKTVDEMIFKDMEKLIIDLRGNGGGFLDEAIEACNAIIKTAPIVHIKDRETMITYMTNLTTQPFLNNNVIVLVDENTASAAEIMALAIQENKLGKIVGEKTVGKGSVQRLYTLESGAGFKLTEAYYLSPNKNIVEGIGVNPDFKIDRFNINIDELESFNYKDNIKIGDRNNDVHALQQRLKYCGYIINDKEGFYGFDTQKAVLDTEKRIYKISYQDNEYIPLRKYFENLGYKVDWDNVNKNVTLEKENQYVRLPIKENIIIVNDSFTNILNPLKTGEGITYVSGEIIEKVLCDGSMNISEIKEFEDVFLKDLFSESNDRQLELAIKLVKAD